jgi:hypothetical protein
MQATLDFQIRHQQENTYTVQVFDRATFQPLAESQFEYDVSYMSRFEVNQLEPDPNDPQGRMERLTAFGKKLYGQAIALPFYKRLIDLHAEVSAGLLDMAYDLIARLESRY